MAAAKDKKPDNVIELLKAGHAVKRPHWEGMQVKLYGTHIMAADERGGAIGAYQLSSNDLFADDWEIVSHGESVG